MAQGLKAGNVDIELFARVHVIHGDGQSLVHHANGFCADTGNADVKCVLKRRQTFQGHALCRRLIEHQLCRARAVLRAIATGAQTFAAASNQEKRELAMDHGGNQKAIGMIAHWHHTFAAGH